jgi:hypothetical protein
MLTPSEFKQMPEWLKIENAIREMQTEHENKCISLASSCDPHAAVEAGFCLAIQAILELPDQLLQVDDKKDAKDEPAEGIRIIGRAHPSPRI